jgi:hypothetical protein
MKRLITVRNIDSSRNATAREGQHVQRGEVGAEERVLLKLLWPRQKWKEFFRFHDKLGKFGRHLFVDHSHETLKFSTHTSRVTVGFNEANVSACELQNCNCLAGSLQNNKIRFNDWALVLDPEPRSILVCVQRASGEALYVIFQHLLLIVVCSNSLKIQF